MRYVMTEIKRESQPEPQAEPQPEPEKEQPQEEIDNAIIVNNLKNLKKDQENIRQLEKEADKARDQEARKPEEIERLKVAIEEKESEPWLDKKREKAYKGLIDNLDIIQKTGGDQSIQETFSHMFGLELGDVKSLKYIKVQSSSASEVADTEITRPVFIFLDISEYQNFSKKLQGESGMSSSGMIISSEKGVPIIIATPNKSFISHEVRHTVDPNVNKREKENQILDELFAYYQEIIVEAELKQYSHLKNPQDGPWNKLINAVGLDIYHEKIEGEVDLSVEDYKEKTRDVVESLRLFAEKYGHIVAQRAILKSKTIEEFMDLLKR